MTPFARRLTSRRRFPQSKLTSSLPAVLPFQKTTVRTAMAPIRPVLRHLIALATALVAATAIAAAGPAPPARPAGNEAGELLPADQACLACHGTGDATLTLENGDKLSLSIDGPAFARSLHRPIGCTGCHASVAPRTHPGKGGSYASARTYAQARNEACRGCHARVFAVYEPSRHGLMLRDGKAGAPFCADCHPSHRVTPPSARDGPDNPCLVCHSDAAAQHASWLPNAARHVDTVACAACHVPDAMRRVDLRLVAAGQPLRDRDGAQQFAQRARAIDADHNGLDANELRALLAEFERDVGDVTLRGGVELRSGLDAHELPPKEKALRDCVACHEANAPLFRFVTVSVLDADGRPVRYEAHREILSSALTWEALRGFYAVGGTRIRLLDAVLGFSLIGAISVPGLHFALRHLARRRARIEGDFR